MTNILRAVPPRYTADGKAIVHMTSSQKAARKIYRDKLSTGQYEILRRPCPICCGTEFTLVAEKDRYGVEVGTGICRSCGLPQTLDLLRPQDYADFYAHIYRQMYAQGSFGGPASLFVQQYARGKTLRELFQAQVPDTKSGSILEIGCGAGGILSAFAEVGFSVTGYDFDERFLRYGRNKGLNLQFGSMDKIPPGTQFDVVILSHVLEHLFDLGDSLSNIKKLLRPGGWLLIEVPGIFAIDYDRYNFDFLRYLQSAHLYHFDSGLLKRLLMKNGFSCRYVDDVARGIFQNVDDVTVTTDPGKHEQVIAFLRRIEAERQRHRVRLFFHRQAQGMRASSSILLQLLGLKGMIDRLRGKQT